MIFNWILFQDNIRGWKFKVSKGDVQINLKLVQVKQNEEY